MKNIVKYLTELIGTMMLVLFGCGVCIATRLNVIATALAFGLAMTSIYSVIGKLSGCHINPAISLAFYIKKEITLKEMISYIIFQIIGGLLGALILYFVFRTKDYLGANIIQNTILYKNGIFYETDTKAYIVAVFIEILLTFVFTMVVLNYSKENKSVYSIIIGITLFLVYLLGANLTGGSVNPARSIGVAILEGGKSLKQLWIFIVSPMAGATIAALVNKYIIKN